MSLSSSSNSSLHPPLDEYLFSAVGISHFTALLISYILLLPLFVLVLYMVYQQWRKQRSVVTATTMCHSDIFTFNMVLMELTSVLGLCIFCYGVFFSHTLNVLIVGTNIYNTISPGQTLFHLLTCVERYLAVVHPVTYVGLRQAGGVRIRNISVGCVWLFCFASPGLSRISFVFNVIYTVLLLVFSSVVVSFCSLSVLCVLIRPKPGEVGGNRERVDQSKQRAFHTIMAITGTLLLRLLSSLVAVVIFFSSSLSFGDFCLVIWSISWFNLPSSLVLPLLFLNRAGKLPGCKHTTVSA